MKCDLEGTWDCSVLKAEKQGAESEPKPGGEVTLYDLPTKSSF